MPEPRRLLPNQPALVVAELLDRDRRVLLFGRPGIGKSTLAAGIADHLITLGRACHCISADPGSPAFGVPGALALASRRPGAWETSTLEPLCTLDAGRFRLPLISGVQRLRKCAAPGVLLLDSPGVVRGMAGRELLQALVEAAGVEQVLVIEEPGRAPPLVEELAAVAVDWCLIEAAKEARRPGRQARARARTAQWDSYLAGAAERSLALDDVAVVGAPPPLDAPETWVGRQVALLRDGTCLALGEVTQSTAGRLGVRLAAAVKRADALLVRDAVRGRQGLLESALPFAPASVDYAPPAGLLPNQCARQGPRPFTRVGSVDAALVNGVFGDPLLHVRLRHQGRSLLFDLGDGGRLSARVAHQVSDVFVSHAHMDHLGGFFWLMRSRIGELPVCRLVGPPGLARQVDGLIRGFLWDRVGEAGPVFEVAELHGDLLQHSRLQAGRAGIETLPSTSVEDGIVLREPGFRVRAITLDHHTPVLAYAWEPSSQYHVRTDRLRDLGLQPGPWINELKRYLTLGELDADVQLPDDSEQPAGALADALILTSPGRRLVYATDLADTAENRARLQGLARNAHTLFLEAAFIEADEAQARKHGHLTARACGEIADAAGVARLVPFHLSRRYLDRPQVVYDEIKAVCPRVAVPPADRRDAGAISGLER